MEQAEHHFAEEWLRDYGDRLYAYALARVGGDTSVAEDLVQETLLAGLKAHESFRCEASRETWLTSILRRKVVDYYRRNARRRESPASDINAEQGIEGLVAELSGVGWRREALDRVETAEFQQVFAACLAELNPRNAEAFLLVVMDGLSSAEACKELGISPTNLSVRLCRARLELRGKLEARWFLKD